MCGYTRARDTAMYSRKLLKVYSCVVASSYVTLCLLSNCVLFTTAWVPPDYLDDYDGPTYFIPQPNNVTFQVGQTALLRCSVENIGNKTVVWRKASDPSPIAIGNIIFSSDTRYEMKIAPERREYNLLIKGVKVRDSGVYHCQVSSRTTLFKPVLLRVKNRPTNLPSQSQISGTGITRDPPYVKSEIVLTGREYVNSGETIRLVCNVTGNTEIPQDVDWFKNGHLLRSPVSKKVHIHKETSIAKRKLDSVLEIKDSKLEDSGVYVCRNSEDLIANQKVIVLNEEKSNTGKRGAAGEAKSGQMCIKQWWTLFIAAFLSTFVTEAFLYLR